VELIVVMALIVLMFFFTFPRIHQFIFTDVSDRAFHSLIQTIENLKQASVRSGEKQTLYLDVYGEKMWSTSDGMDGEQRESSQNQSYRFPESLKLMHVDLPLKREKKENIAKIDFYPQGYSDKAVIYLVKDREKKFSLVVEPFLSNVRIVGAD
jgi:Tfp pilus assembly protein FimT